MNIKIIVLLETCAIIVLTLCYFYNPDLDQKTIDLQNRIDEQKSTLNNIEASLSKTQKTNEELVEIRDDLMKSIDLMRAEKDGKTITYFIEVELKQSHFSLDLSTHAKDAMNAVKLSIPVDKEYYNRLEVGSPILDEFRGGSFLMEGSVGNWKVKVTRKWTSIS